MNGRELLNDKDLANLVGFSPGWVRVQRHFRRRGKPHSLTIDPVLVGSKPRYPAKEVEGWIEGLKNQPRNGLPKILTLRPG